MNDPRGAQWRKWDLHVHTPASIVQRYGGDTDAVWEQFISDLESLPPECAVIGINDYIFIEGYKRVLREREKGRLKNIQTFFPIIELRLDRFAGSPGHLQRVNFHVIFSDLLPAQLIEQQFLAALSRHYKLSADIAHPQVEWNAIPTQESLADLGQKIIESVPEAERHKYGNPLQEGFNNLNLSLDDIHRALENSYLRANFITAVGKAEWDQIKWNDRSIAEKKNIINQANFVFTAGQSPERCRAAAGYLRSSKVNDRLLDCSDAHAFSASTDKDRIGNCFTWIKADPTFAGLKHTLIEPGERIYLGDEPPQLRSMRNNRTKYAVGVRLRKKEGSRLEDAWFDGIEQPLNPGLVAIIGNKGSGKSALAEVIGLLGNTENERHFSFLIPPRFRKHQPGGSLATHFEGELIWESGQSATCALDAKANGQQAESVKCIPQQFFESICNEAPGGRVSQFEQELMKVIFAHIPAPDRLGKVTMEDLIQFGRQRFDESIRALRVDLQRVNREIIELESRLTPEHRREVQNHLEKRRAELASLNEAEPPKIEAPQTDDPLSIELSRQLEAAATELRSVDGQIQAANASQAQATLAAANLDQILHRILEFQRNAQAQLSDLDVQLQPYNITAREVVRLEVNDQPIRQRREEFGRAIDDAKQKTSAETAGSLAQQRAIAANNIAIIRSQLDGPLQAYQAYLQARSEWEERRKSVFGDPNTPETVAFWETQLAKFDEFPAMLDERKAKRRELAVAIHGQLLAMRTMYGTLFQAIQRFTANHPVIAEKLALDFAVQIVEAGFSDAFFRIVTHGVAGTFCGQEQGEKALRQLKERYDLEDPDQAVAFAEAVEASLRADMRFPEATRTSIRVEPQLRKGSTTADLYNLLYSFEYLRPQYLLKVNSKDTSQLSPGEKGTLLVAFYLLLDLDDLPLIIDQPEENLDNQTVYSLLVPSIREARQRRQVIMVTHNPNLAVVCDADQIIYASMDKEDRNRVTYVSGAIENPAINRRIVDVLEGTRPAFDNRKDKYSTSPSE